jgi:hypothetical protein
VKSRISLEPCELNADETEVTEIMISIEREDEPEPDLRDQVLLMTPKEMDALYARMKLYYEQGIWSTGSVER